MGDLQAMIDKMQAGAAAAAAGGAAPAPGTPGAPAPSLGQTLMMPAIVGGLAYFATDKNWKWAAAIAGVALFLQKK